MRKHYLIYLFFWLPAFLASFFSNATASFFGGNISIVLQWFFAFFMLLGFGLNSASAAYRYPRGTMAFILGYTGINLLIITAFYATRSETALYYFFRDYAGFLSYVPLEVMVMALLDFNMQKEVFVTILVAACCLFGYLAGILRRRVNPDPYSPRIG